MITMGNFFSGSGTWELAAKICGIEVLFESEIEPFPVALEAKRFPNAIQLGDVAKVDGTKIPKVDILTSSSPCQDLSVAGLRKGLKGERSGLFQEVIRITKEMRNVPDDNGRLFPRFWCWENVPGAFSSRGGGRLPDGHRTSGEGGRGRCPYTYARKGMELCRSGRW